MKTQVSRRDVLLGGAAAIASGLSSNLGLAEQTFGAPASPLEEFGYEQVKIRSPRQVAQRENVTAVLTGLDEDSLLKPFREMAGKPAPGASLGGWYEWKPDYDPHHDDAGLAPGSTFGQWTSALARLYAGSQFNDSVGNGGLRDRAIRLNRLLGESIDPKYFAQTRFPGYSFDKLVCGLMDGRRLLNDDSAFATLNAVTDAAISSLPGHAVDREVQWKLGSDLSWMWDETYTLPENLYLVSALGTEPRYRQMAAAYLNDATYFEPLSRGVNVLGDKHAYSYVNSLCSAMQAYLTGGSRMHLEAAKNGFAMLEQQSFATGGWGPDELLRKSGYGELTKSLTASHNGFETPCGSYAHMKLTRYLLRATRDGRYGDSMERVLHNTVLGALPLQADGRSFYSSDYNFAAKRVYSVHRWPCCSGTLPQVVADYGINSYLREHGAVWVNLYQPSEVRWKEGTGTFALEQTGGYPPDGNVRMRFTGSRSLAFALRLRIPAWSAGGAQDGPHLRVNGTPVPLEARQGFATLERTWKSGDMVELELPLSLRVETLPEDGGPPHAETVALLRGPLVLFAIREPGDVGPLRASREALLSARHTGPSEWTAQTANGSRRMVPFVDVGDREYSTYLTLS